MSKKTKISVRTNFEEEGIGQVTWKDITKTESSYKVIIRGFTFIIMLHYPGT